MQDCERDGLTVALREVFASALDVAEAPPARRHTNSFAALVPWTRIERLRAALWELERRSDSTKYTSAVSERTRGNEVTA